ncbi:MAG: endolytic transglycosylase MltG [Alphaproteobacteria bacterium]|nr:endolytic transglycosylase MltG [Alphaproteobacteria bacterium]
MRLDLVERIRHWCWVQFRKGPLTPLFALCGAVIFVGCLLLLWGNHQFHRVHAHTKPVLIEIPKGTGLLGVSRLLEHHQLIDNAWIFAANVALRLSARSLKAGEYEIMPEVSAKDIFLKMQHGETYKRRLTIIEGLKAQEVVSIIHSAYGLKGTVSTIPEEGWLLPETYFYAFEDDRNQLLSRMKLDMDKHLDRAWQERASNLPMQSKREALVLASIVEKETCVKEERPRVAAVFLNRLRQGMPLQADPTVIYGIEKETGRPLARELNQKDLTHVTSYNTYLMAGLPPTPICNPGLASIKAVLNPVVSDELYFVADGSGGHVFSATYREHAIHHQALRKARAQAKAVKKN